MRAEGFSGYGKQKSRKDGIFISIRNLAGEPCVLVTDIPEPVFNGEREYKVVRLQEGVYQIDLKKSEEIVV